MSIYMDKNTEYFRELYEDLDTHITDNIFCVLSATLNLFFAWDVFKRNIFCTYITYVLVGDGMGAVVILALQEEGGVLLQCLEVI